MKNILDNPGMSIIGRWPTYAEAKSAANFYRHEWRKVSIRCGMGEFFYYVYVSGRK